MTTIAYFISSHGYGHASRAAAVMQAMYDLEPTIHFEIFSQIPAWLFTDTLPPIFTHHPILTDIGVAQPSSLVEDLPETHRQLAEFLPFDTALVQRLATQIKYCNMVICDIAPLGIAVARAAGVPSMLIENFTWDWIYEGYLAAEPRLAQHIDYLREIFAQADYHVQSEPICHYRQADLMTPPISRPIKMTAMQTRQQLGLPDEAKMVLLTMGGVAQNWPNLAAKLHLENLYLVLAGQMETERRGQVIYLGKSSGFYHPDLINASDAVIGKVGYSTLAEIYQAGVPYGYIARPRFRESAPLVAFIEQHMVGLPISEAEFMAGQWPKQLVRLLAMPRKIHPNLNGALAVAEFVTRKIYQ